MAIENDHLTDEQIDRFTDMILDLRDKVKAKKKWKSGNTLDDKKN